MNPIALSPSTAQFNTPRFTGKLDDLKTAHTEQRKAVAEESGQQRLETIKAVTARCLANAIIEFSHDGKTQVVFGFDILDQIDHDTRAYTGGRNFMGKPFSAGSTEVQHYCRRYSWWDASRPISFPKDSQFKLLPQAAIRNCLDELMELGLVEAQMTHFYFIGADYRLSMTELGRKALEQFRPEIQKREAALQPAGDTNTPEAPASPGVASSENQPPFRGSSFRVRIGVN